MTSQEVKEKQEGEEQHPVAAWGRWGEARREGAAAQNGGRGRRWPGGEKAADLGRRAGLPLMVSSVWLFIFSLCPAKGQLEMS